MAPVHHILFERHADDLQRVYPSADRIFVCPICFQVFDARHIDSEDLSVGHVWPEHIRRGTIQAVHHHVLLCKSCNSAAGRNADASMQEFEKIHQETKARHLTTPPRVQILASGRPDKKPIRVGLFIEPKGENTISFALESPRTEKQRRNNHAIAKRIIDYMKEGPISLVVEPPANITLARIGWLTSAYLFAFYTFGYRYIFQSCLDQVRHYIRRSFLGQVDNGLEFSNEKVLTVARWDDIVCIEPRIGLLVPVDPARQTHMRIDFRDVHIRMPVSCTYSISWDREPTEADLEREFVVDGTTHQPHDELCQWEDGFGAPTYIVEGHTIVDRSTIGDL